MDIKKNIELCGKGGLFENRHALAILLNETEEYKNLEVETVLVYLSNVLSGKKPFSKKFESALKKILANTKKVSDVENYYYYLLATVKDTSLLEQTNNYHNDYLQLLEEIKNAKCIYLFNIDLKDNFKITDIFDRILSFFKINANLPVGVKYYFTQQQKNEKMPDLAFQFWEQVHIYAVNNSLTEEEFIGKIQVFNAFELESYLPVVVFDSITDTERSSPDPKWKYLKERVFIVNPHETNRNRIGVVRFTGIYYDFWKKEALIQVFENKMNFEPVLYNDIKEILEINRKKNDI